MLIQTNQVVNVIDAAQGTMFNVVFLKKDGTLRKLNGRCGVKRYLKGGNNKLSSDNIVVYDVQAKGYRSFNPKRVIQINAIGHRFVTTSSISLVKEVI